MWPSYVPSYAPSAPKDHLSIFQRQPPAPTDALAMFRREFRTPQSELQISLKAAQSQQTATQSELLAARSQLEASRSQLEGSQRTLAATQCELLAARSQREASQRTVAATQSQLEASQRTMVTTQSQLVATQTSLAASLKREATAAQALALAGATASTLVESLMQKIEAIEGEKEALWHRSFRMPFAGESDPPTPDSILSHVNGALLPFFDKKETLVLRGVCREFEGVIWEALTTGGGRSELPYILKILECLGKDEKGMPRFVHSQNRPPSAVHWKSDMKSLLKKS